MITPAGWLFDVLGVKDVYDALGTLFPRRQSWRLLGPRISDNPTLGTTDVTFSGGVAPGSDMPDASTTYTWSSAQQVRRFQAGVLTVNRAITLGAIGPQVGDEWAFPVFAQAHTLAFYNAASVLLFTAPIGYIGTPVFRFNGADWEVIRL